MGIASIVNKQTKTTLVEEALVDAIMNAIKVSNPPSRSTKANIKPSKIQCERQMYYILTRCPPNELTTTDPKLILIQKIGSYIHLLLQEAMSKADKQGLIYRDPQDIVKAAEAKGLHTHIVPATHSTDNPYECHCYNDEYGLSFMWDGGIYFKDLNVLVEIKSEDHFKNIKRVAPDEEHIEQVSCYSLALGIDIVVFLYVNRNYLNIKAFRVNVTNEMRQTIIDKIERAKANVERKELPEKTTCKACKYCDYTKACKSNLNSGLLEPVEKPEESAEDEREDDPE